MSTPAAGAGSSGTAKGRFPAGAAAPMLRLPRPAWVPDDQMMQCSKCSNSFSQLNRRHHCRQCGKVFCKTCCHRRLGLPQLGYDKPERVCENCYDVALYISYATNETAAVQITCIKELAGHASKKDRAGLADVVSMGGLETIIFLCSSPSDEVIAAAAQALETFAQQEDVQNILVVKGILPVLFRICSAANITHLGALTSVANILFALSRNVDICRMMIADTGLQALLALCSRTATSFQTSPRDQQMLAEVQTIGARSISYLSMNQSNQTKIIEDKKGGLDQLLHLLAHPNGNVKKYVAKTFAYLSLRNDKLKTRILCGEGTDALVALIKHEKLRETLSHASCTIANLATNGDSHEALMNHGKLVEALCVLSVRMNEDTEIQRHIIRGLANFALYESNRAALVAAVPEIVRLGSSYSADIQRHAVRAIDNLLNHPNRQVLAALREHNVNALLQRLATSAAMNAEIKKRAQLALERLAQPDDELAPGADGDGAATAPVPVPAPAVAATGADDGNDDAAIEPESAEDDRLLQEQQLAQQQAREQPGEPTPVLAETAPLGDAANQSLASSHSSLDVEEKTDEVDATATEITPTVDDAAVPADAAPTSEASTAPASEASSAAPASEASAADV